MPSPSPSILVLGQFRKNQVASSQEVIWEQYCRPSHWRTKLAVCCGVSELSASAWLNEEVEVGETDSAEKRE